MEEYKIKYINEWSEENFIAWIDDCPFCHAATIAGYNEYIKGDDESTIFAVWFCADCDKVYNWDEESPEVIVRWINKQEAESYGWNIAEESEETVQPDKGLLN